MPSIVKRVQIEPLPLELQLSIFNEIKEYLLEEACIRHSYIFLCKQLRIRLEDVVYSNNIELPKYPKDVLMERIKDSWNMNMYKGAIQLQIVNSLPNKLTLVELLELIKYDGYIPSSTQEAILKLLFPLFNRSNIQEHSDKEFVISGCVWFSTVTPVYIPRKFGDKKLFNKFVEKSNYHRYIFVCKIIEQLELMIKVKQ